MRTFIATLSLGILFCGSAVGAPILTQIQVTMPGGMPSFDPGDVLGITGTYSDSQRSYSVHTNGPNGFSEFGQGDDERSYDDDYYFNPLYSSVSAAQVSISGWPAGSPPVPTSGWNFSAMFIHADGGWHYERQADAGYLYVRVNGLGEEYFRLDQTIWLESGERSILRNTFGGTNLGLIARDVPEPSTLGLLALGLAGVAFAGYRRNRSR